MSEGGRCALQSSCVKHVLKSKRAKEAIVYVFGEGEHPPGRKNPGNNNCGCFLPSDCSLDENSS